MQEQKEPKGKRTRIKSTSQEDNSDGGLHALGARTKVEMADS